MNVFIDEMFWVKYSRLHCILKDHMTVSVLYVISMRFDLAVVLYNAMLD